MPQAYDSWATGIMILLTQLSAWKSGRVESPLNNSHGLESFFRYELPVTNSTSVLTIGFLVHSSFIGINYAVNQIVFVSPWGTSFSSSLSLPSLVRYIFSFTMIFKNWYGIRTLSSKTLATASSIVLFVSSTAFR